MGPETRLGVSNKAGAGSAAQTFRAAPPSQAKQLHKRNLCQDETVCLQLWLLPMWRNHEIVRLVDFGIM